MVLFTTLDGSEQSREGATAISHLAELHYPVEFTRRDGRNSYNCCEQMRSRFQRWSRYQVRRRKQCFGTSHHRLNDDDRSRLGGEQPGL